MHEVPYVCPSVCLVSLGTEGLSVLVSQKLEVTLLLNDHPSSQGIKKVICVLNYLDFPLHQGVE